MNIKCFLSGHKHEPTHDRYNNDVCSRCGMHEYYDSIFTGGRVGFSFWENTIPYKWHLLRRKVAYKKATLFKKCSDCGKQEYRFGIEVGDHRNCLPF